jgi:twitching motility protein PilU
VIYQALVPRIEGGRAAVEIILANTPVKNLIHEGKTHILPNTIHTHSEIGMQTFDEALVDLHQQGVIE